MKKHFLYLIPFKDGLHFKIGLCSDEFKRIKQLKPVYDYDLERAFIVSSQDRRKIKILEDLLLCITPEINTFFPKSGYTEIRGVQHWDQVWSKVSQESEDMQLEINPAKNHIPHLFERQYVAVKPKKSIYNDKQARLNNIKSVEILADSFSFLEEFVSKVTEQNSQILVELKSPAADGYSLDMTRDYTQIYFGENLYNLFQYQGVNKYKNSHCIIFNKPGDRLDMHPEAKSFYEDFLDKLIHLNIDNYTYQDINNNSVGSARCDEIIKTMSSIRVIEGIIFETLGKYLISVQCGRNICLTFNLADKELFSDASIKLQRRNLSFYKHREYPLTFHELNENKAEFKLYINNTGFSRSMYKPPMLKYKQLINKITRIKLPGKTLLLNDAGEYNLVAAY